MNKDHFVERQKTASLKDKRQIIIRLIILVLVPLSLFLCPSCSPEAVWETENVEITMNVTTVSAGFIRCDFSTNKEAYYLVACEPARPGENPMDHQKQFMMLALDSANVTYLEWRHELLEQGEINIAPFSSHALSYGKVSHTFTMLVPDSTYWIYAFVVNPTTMTPSGKLFLQEVHTSDSSTVDVHFEYRVKGYWDYIYPLNSKRAIVDYYPYIAATCDSAEVMQTYNQSPTEYLTELFSYIAANRETLLPNLRYGVDATDNSYFGTGYESFVEGRTYYTAIAGCDGYMEEIYIFRFIWMGEKFEAYFTDEDSIVVDGENG